MKRIRLLVLLALALLLIGALFLLRQLRGGAATEPANTNTVSDVAAAVPKTPEPPPQSRGGRSSKIPDLAPASAEQNRRLAEAGVTPGMTKEQMRERLANLAHAQRQAAAENWQKPIEFYGTVVDQSNQPVSDVQVHLIWTDTSVQGSSEAVLPTDLQGRFALTGKTGRMLQVWLRKDGYYVPKTNRNNFDYAAGFMADPNNPVTFGLVKKGQGANLITSQYGMSRTLDFSASSRDGSPVRVDFFNRKVGADGQMEVSQAKPPYGTWQTATGWSYRLAIPDGGLVETSEEFPFEAPASGYQPVREFHFQKGEPNWTERIDKTFYIVFGNPRRFGRIHVETSMTTGTILEYAINPDGSQNLEPK